MIDQGLKIKPYIDEQLISRLVEDKLNKMWGWFVGFGNFISGLLGVFVAWKILMICLNITINMSILYQTFGCSFKVLAGIFASMTHYFMHKSHSQSNKQKPRKITTEEINHQNMYLLNTVNEQPIPASRQLYPPLKVETSNYQTPRRTL